MNYQETVEYIHSLKKFNKKATLDEMREVMNRLGCDYDKMKYIHIAGTNGKGSVSTMMSEIARAEGLKVGLFTSPYIICFRERIQVDGEMIPEDDLVRLADRIIKTGVSVKAFEFITALALLYFEERGCDLIVLECGLGGKDDSTNIISSPLCSVITHIGLDHTEILGDTIADITRHKMGIVKENCPLVVSPNQPKEAMNIIAFSDAVICSLDKVNIISSDISGSDFEFENRRYRVNMAGQYQVANAVAAIETAKVIGMFSYESIKKGISTAIVPARAEKVCDTPSVIIDGAHNPDGAVSLKSIVEKTEGNKTAVIAMMQDKDIEGVLEILLPLFDRVICTEVSGNMRSVDVKDLASMARKYSSCVLEYERAQDAVNKAVQYNDTVFIFGSLYLASEIRPIFIK